MKKILIFLICITLIFTITACAEKKNLTIPYGQEVIIENDVFNNYDQISWIIEDESIVSVDNGTISPKAPGATTVTASADVGGKEKILGVYTINVTINPATNIVFATNNLEITADETATISYTLYPEDASDYGLSWKSADEAVATVDDDGLITAVSAGQTTILLSTSDGVIATCAVTVNQKPAYERLSEAEKAFVDSFLPNIDLFKNPDSVEIKAISTTSVSDAIFSLKISAQNGFGATNTNTYVLIGGSLFDYDTGASLFSTYSFSNNGAFNVDLINEALAEKR